MTGTGRLSKAQLLVRVLPANREEFGDRLATKLEVNWERLCAKPPYDPSLGFTEAVRLMGKGLSTDISLSDVSATCRALAPAIVLETGVAYGVTSAFVLQALARNGKGELLSVDLLPLGQEADGYVGTLIPRDLRDRWLHRVPSKRVLPPLLSSVGNIDVFIHDSLRTYRNMTSEFQAVWPRLRPAGALIADDAGDNRSFVEFAKKADPRCWALARKESKDSVFGVLFRAS